MVAKELKKKRKVQEEDEEEVQETAFPQNVGLELQSEDEASEGEESEGEVDEFPEIDTRSDSEDDEEADEEGESGEEDEDETEEESEDGTSEDISDDELHIFPKSKTIISDITGQPKRVYPPIEPDYDSDSSTEEVRLHRPLTFHRFTSLFSR